MWVCLGQIHQFQALTKPVKIGGRIVPAGAQIETIRYVPPGSGGCVIMPLVSQNTT